MNASPAPAADAAAAELGVTRALLRMAVGRDVLALPIASVREILQAPRLTPLPRTPAFVRGVMNLRGAVVPVIDLAVRLAHPAATVVAPAAMSRRSCVVVVETGEEPIDGAPPAALGLLVDAVHEVFDVPAGEVEPVPPLGTRVAGQYLAAMVRTRGQVIPLLALERVLASAELSSLIERHGVH